MAKVMVGGKVDAELELDLKVLSGETGLSKSALVERALVLLFEQFPVDDLMRRRFAKAEAAKAKNMEKMGIAGTRDPLRTPPTAAELPTPLLLAA